MEKSSLSQSLKNIKPYDLVYPGISVLFFGTIILLFFFTIRFMSQNINKAFSLESGGSSQTLGLEKYTLVAKKLNIPVNIPQEGIPDSQEAVPEMSTAVPNIEVSTSTQEAVPEISAVVSSIEVSTSTQVTPVTPPDKSAITITVRNSTTKKGAATVLAKMLEDDGFQKPQTGNEPKLHEITTILLKDSKQEYKTMLLEAVRKAYPEAVATTSEESGTTDAIIIIGNR